jgi:hypothetical protein
VVGTPYLLLKSENVKVHNLPPGLLYGACVSEVGGCASVLDGAGGCDVSSRYWRRTYRSRFDRQVFQLVMLEDYELVLGVNGWSICRIHLLNSVLSSKYSD